MLAELQLTVLRQIPVETITGLLSGAYSLHGGVIRDAGGRIVAHLATATAAAPAALGSLIPGVGDLLNGVQLWKIGRDVAAMQKTLDTVLQTATTVTVLSGLGLVTSITGFAYLNRKLSRIDEKLDEMAKDVKDIKLSQESLHRSELQAALDSARHAEASTDEAVRRGLLFDSKREFNKLTHLYKQQWSRCKTVPEIQTIGDLYTLAFLGYAMVCSELGLRDAAAVDLGTNSEEWTRLAREHARQMLGAHPERLIGGEYVERLPAKVLVELLDFAHGERRGIEWIDTLRSDAQKRSSLLGNLVASAPDALRRQLGTRESAGAIELARALRARSEVLDANVAHYAFLQHRQISTGAFQLELDRALRESGAEAVCVVPAEPATV